MTFWLLILLGIFTYFVVHQSVASITRTPIWALWLVMMTPALILAGWTLAYSADEPIPRWIMIGLFVVCPLMYWVLIQWGRTPKSQAAEAKAEQAATDDNPSAASSESGAAALQKPQPKLRPINKEEEAHLQSCFPWSIYYLQNIEYRPQAMICRGQLRTSPEVAYQTVQDNVQAQFGDRFLVIFQEGLNGKPFFALVPNPQARKADQPAPPVTRPGLAATLLLLTFLTTTLIGIHIAGAAAEGADLPSSPLGTEIQQVLPLLAQGLPYSVALLIILGTHELGHYFVARRYQIRTTLPYFIPVPWFLGTFGAFIQLKSPIPSRKALFDVGIAGPLAGFLITLPLLLWGLSQSDIVALPDTPSLLNFEAFVPSSSLLIALLSKLALGSQLTASGAIALHPVAVAGCLGLVVTALNLMPIGQLDGGHIVHAMFGQRMGAVIGQITRLLVFILAFFVQRELIVWAILLLFIPAVDEPALNDVSELDDRRDFLGLLALAILATIILPTPRTLMQLLF